MVDAFSMMDTTDRSGGKTFFFLVREERFRLKDFVVTINLPKRF